MHKFYVDTLDTRSSSFKLWYSQYYEINSQISIPSTRVGSQLSNVDTLDTRRSINIFIITYISIWRWDQAKRLRATNPIHLVCYICIEIGHLDINLCVSLLLDHVDWVTYYDVILAWYKYFSTWLCLSIYCCNLVKVWSLKRKDTSMVVI